MPATFDSDKKVLLVGEQVQVDREALHALLKDFHVRRLSVFGSAARGELGVNSDIDLLVEFEPNKTPSLGKLFDLQTRLSDLLGGRPVDLATPAILKNPYRRNAIEKDLKVLHAA